VDGPVRARRARRGPAAPHPPAHVRPVRAEWVRVSVGTEGRLMGFSHTRLPIQPVPDRDPDAHLRSAAAALERVLTRKWPQHTWVVEVGQPDPGDGRAVTDNANTVSDRDPAPAPGRRDSDELDEAA
jgi:hypothetical protein